MKKNIKIITQLLVIITISMFLWIILPIIYRVENNSFVKHIDISSLSQDELTALKKCKIYPHLVLLKKVEPIKPEEAIYKFTIQAANSYNDYPVIGKVPIFDTYECVSLTAKEEEDQKIIDSKIKLELKSALDDTRVSSNKDREFRVLILAKEPKLLIEDKLISSGKWTSNYNNEFVLLATVKLSDLKELALDANVLSVEAYYDSTGF